MPHTGVCPQYNVLFDKLTVTENLQMVAALRELSPEATQKRIAQCIKDVQLESKRDTLASVLSGGQKRKLCVAMAFLSGDSVVILGQ